MGKFCKSCGNELTDGMKFCGECGAKVEIEAEMPKTEAKQGFLARNKKPIAIILIIALLISGFVYYRNNRWKWELEVRFVGYTRDKTEYYNYSRYEYEVTNTTSRTLEDVVMVFVVSDSIFDSQVTVEKWVGDLKCGETKTVVLYEKAVDKEVEESGKPFPLGGSSPDLKKIKYK